MIIYSDSISFSDTIIEAHESWQPESISSFSPNLQSLAKGLYGARSIQKSKCLSESRWAHAFIVRYAPSSHYDLLIDLCRKNIPLDDGIVCLAGSGRKLHGQHGRDWIALEGNIHLSVFLAPNRKIGHFHAGFMALAAASLIETVDRIKGLHGRSGIKWVNDILIEGRKIAGFLVYTISNEDTVTAAVLGIGLNVEKTPEVPPDPFVQKAASLGGFVSDPSFCNLKDVLKLLLLRLSENYHLLLDGQHERLIDIYRKRSLVIGRDARVLSDPEDGIEKEIASGRVIGIGDNLELIFEGRDKPVTRGRMILNS